MIVQITDGPAMAANMRRDLTQVMPNDASLAHGYVLNLAMSGAFVEAERVLAELERIDRPGLWAYSARLQLAAIRGELPLGSEGAGGETALQ